MAKYRYNLYLFSGLSSVKVHASTNEVLALTVLFFFIVAAGHTHSDILSTVLLQLAYGTS